LQIPDILNLKENKTKTDIKILKDKLLPWSNKQKDGKQSKKRREIKNDLILNVGSLKWKNAIIAGTEKIIAREFSRKENA